MKRCLTCDQTFEQEGWRCPGCGHEPPQRQGHLVFAPALANGEGDADYADDAILAAERRHFWFEARSRLIEQTVARHLGSATSLLEIGCGTGHVLSGLRRAFPRLRLAATDRRVSTLALAAPRLPGVPLYQTDARRLPFRGEFDAIGAFDVIEHIDEDGVVLAEMQAALCPRGGLVLTVPQHPALWSALDAWSGHRRRYTRRELRSKMERAGFEVVHATSFTSLLLPALWLSRRRRLPAGFDPLAELRIGDFPNVIFRGVSRVEEALRRVGMSFPAGGSLLMVGRAR